jgi:plasmid stability protein
MSQLLVSNLDEDIETELKSRAEIHGWSVEDEVRQILVDALKQPGAGEESDSVGLGTRIAALFAGVGLDADIPEWKGEKIEPIEWE